MATLGEKLDLWEAGQLSDAGNQKLINRVMMGSLDEMGTAEGIDMDALRTHMQEKTGVGRIAVGQTPISAPQAEAVEEKREHKEKIKGQLAKTHAPIGEMVTGAVKGVGEMVTEGGKGVEEFLGIKPLEELVDASPEAVAEYERLNTEFAEALEREGFNEKAGKTLFDIAALVYGGGVGRKALTSGAAKLGAGKKALTAAGVVGESLGSTLAFEAATEQELPTAGEFGLDLALSAAIPFALRKTYSLLKPKQVDEIIDLAFTKAVRPSVKGKKSLGKLADAKQSARDAVKSVVTFKDALELTDSAGRKVIGELPQNLAQFGEAVDQVQELIFRQYDNLAIEAGGQGVAMNFDEVLGGKLDEVINSKALQASDPATVKYAEVLKERYADLGDLGVQDVQDVIKNLNAKLKAFYGKASGDVYSQLYVDALVANNLRKNIDELIQGATGGQYQELKTAYGSLKSIQDDLMHRIIVDARKNGVSLPQFADVFSVGDILMGIGTLNPAQVGKGASQLALRKVLSLMNDPNEIIKRMFNQLDEMVEKGGGQAFKKGSASLASFIDEAKAAGKTLIVDSDELKKTLPGYKPELAPEFHKESSKLASELYEMALKDPAFDDVVLMAGGSGSGKSEAVVNKSLNNPGQIIFDGTLADLEKAQKKIDAAVEANKPVRVEAVYAPIDQAFQFATGRSRNVPRSVFAEKHQGFRETLLTLANNNPNLEIRITLNSLDGTVPIEFPSRDELIQFLQSEVKTAAEVDELITAGLSEKALDITKSDGGVTISKGGFQPSQGFAFAPQKLTETKIALDQVTPEDIQAFLQKHNKLLSDPNNFLGAWVEDGMVWLDVSTVLDDKEAALKAAEVANQEAIFDLSSFETIFLKPPSEL